LRPAGAGGKEAVPVWKLWRHPALVGVGDVDAWACETGFVLNRFAKRPGILIRCLWTPWPSGLEAQGEAFYQALEMIMKRLPKPGVGRPVQPFADATELLEKWPTLAGWLTDPTYEDGSPRIGGWAAINCRDGVWTALMKDQSEGLCIVVSAPSPLRLLDLMEHALTSPEAPWRLDLPKGEGKPRKKK